MKFLNTRNRVEIQLVRPWIEKQLLNCKDWNAQERHNLKESKSNLRNNC